MHGYYRTVVLTPRVSYVMGSIVVTRTVLGCTCVCSCVHSFSGWGLHCGFTGKEYTCVCVCVCACTNREKYVRIIGYPCKTNARNEWRNFSRFDEAIFQVTFQLRQGDCFCKLIEFSSNSRQKYFAIRAAGPLLLFVKHYRRCCQCKRALKRVLPICGL